MNNYNKNWIIILIFLLLLCGIASATDRIFTITMSDVRSSYEIDYGNITANVTSYTFESSVDLLGVQNWALYGSNDAAGWSYIDDQNAIAFTAGVPQTFTPVDPKNYTYYLIYLSDGFYTGGGVLTITFHATEYNNPKVLCPTTGSGIPLLPSRQFNVTIGNTRSSYEVDYVSLISNMTSYSIESDTDLDAVQSWTIYGSDANNATGWSYIDDQSAIAFTAGVSQTFTPADPKNYTYYFIYLSDGFYVGGTDLNITFYSTEYYNLLTPCGLPVPPLPPYIKSAGYPPIPDIHLLDRTGPGGTIISGAGRGYVDFNVWISVVISSMVLLMVAIMLSGDKLWKVFASGLSFLLASGAAWGSLSIAYMNDVTELGKISTYNNTTTNVSVFHTPVTQVVASGWTTLTMVIVSILLLLYLIHSILLFTENVKIKKKLI